MNFRASPSNKPYKTRYLLSIERMDEELRAKELAISANQQLHSSFALDQLTHLATRCEPASFILTMAPVFGFDIPAHTYFKLHQALLAGDLENPRLLVEATQSYPADYDNLDRTTRIHPDALAHILENPDRYWELLAILLHEFGHHLDNVLRQDLADKKPDGTSTVARDAALEEGAGYANLMSLFEPPEMIECGSEIATCTLADGNTVTLNACYFNTMEMIHRTQGTTPRHRHTLTDEREGFESGSGGKGKSTHQTIEEALRPLGFDSQDLDAIYFGNWLRDYSQLLDPKIVRATSMQKKFPEMLSRETLTRIVDVIAATKFTASRSTGTGFRVTQQNLGVYRPSQHIDNPRVVNPQPIDPQSRDPDFEPWVFSDDPILEVDPESSMKRYIQRSVVIMQEELRAVMGLGRSTEGLRMFGSALHIVEDLFAHSNFVELSLIKTGHHQVVPWTSKADCKHGLPLVTGTFGGVDVIASLAAPLGELLYSTKDVAFKPTVSGHRSERDQIMLLLLNEHPDNNFLKVFETYLAARDKWAELPFSEYVEMRAWFTGELARPLSNAYNTMMQGLLRLIGNSISDLQTLKGDDPNTNGSTDPSHSQLSKDHAEHPLHSLAASLATDAVIQVAQAMIDYWEGNLEADPVKVATAYFIHPMDSTWQDEKVRDWADANPNLLKLSTSKSDLDSIHEELDKVAEESVTKLEKDGTEILDFMFGSEDNKNSFFNLVINLFGKENKAEPMKAFLGDKH